MTPTASSTRCGGDGRLGVSALLAGRSASPTPRHGPAMAFRDRSGTISMTPRRSTCRRRAAPFPSALGQTSEWKRRSPSGFAKRPSRAWRTTTFWVASNGRPSTSRSAPRSSRVGASRWPMRRRRACMSHCFWVRAIQSASSRERWADQLASFSVTLSEAAGAHASGGGAQVLGSPIKALKYLVRELARHGGEPLRAGEFVTTGTLTQALPAAPGDDGGPRLEAPTLPTSKSGSPSSGMHRNKRTAALGQATSGLRLARADVRIIDRERSRAAPPTPADTQPASPPAAAHRGSPRRCPARAASAAAPVSPRTASTPFARARSSNVACTPVSSILRHRNARASALTMALSTRGRGAHGAPLEAALRTMRRRGRRQ